MSFRKEEKIVLNYVNYINIKNFIKKNKGNTLFPERNIKSIYFDNIENKMFLDSEEGILPRKKIRVRTYPNFNNQWYLEKKINSVEGKFKKSIKINNNLLNDYLKQGIYDSTYGNCFPNLIVEYSREYFQIENIRITLDKSVVYKSFLNNKTINKNNQIIVEFKTNNLNKLQLFNGEIPFQFIRMSKYCEAFTELFNPPYFYREKLN